MPRKALEKKWTIKMELMKEINQLADTYEPPVEEEHVMTTRMLSSMNPSKKSGAGDSLVKDLKDKGKKIKSKAKDLMGAMKSARKKNNWK